MFYFPEVLKRFLVGGAREGVLKWVGRDTANNFFLWPA